MRLARPDHVGQQPARIHFGRWGRGGRELRLVRHRQSVYRRRLDYPRLALQRQRNGQFHHRHAPDLHLLATMQWRDHPAILFSRDPDIDRRCDTGWHMERWLDHDGLQRTHGRHQRLLRRRLRQLQRPAPQDRRQRRALLPAAAVRIAYANANGVSYTDAYTDSYSHPDTDANS